MREYLPGLVVEPGPRRRPAEPQIVGSNPTQPAMLTVDFLEFGRQRLSLFDLLSIETRRMRFGFNCSAMDESLPSGAGPVGSALTQVFSYVPFFLSSNRVNQGTGVNALAWGIVCRSLAKGVDGTQKVLSFPAEWLEGVEQRCLSPLCQYCPSPVRVDT